MSRVAEAGERGRQANSGKVIEVAKPSDVSAALRDAGQNGNSGHAANSNGSGRGRAKPRGPLEMLERVDGVTILNREPVRDMSKPEEEQARNPNLKGGYEIGASIGMHLLGIDGHHEAVALDLGNGKSYVFDFLWCIYIGERLLPLAEEEHGPFERPKQVKLNQAAELYRPYLHSRLVQSYDMSMLNRMLRLEHAALELKAKGATETELYEELYRQESESEIDKTLRRFFDQGFVLREPLSRNDSNGERKLKDFIALVDYVLSRGDWGWGIDGRMQFDVDTYTRMRNIWVKHYNEPRGVFTVKIGESAYVSAEGLSLWVGEYIMDTLDLIAAKASALDVNGERVPAKAFLSDLPKVDVTIDDRSIPISEYVESRAVA